MLIFFIFQEEILYLELNIRAQSVRIQFKIAQDDPLTPFGINLNRGM